MLILMTGTRHATIADHGLTVQQAILETVRAGGEPGPHHIYVGDAGGVDFIVRTMFERLASWAIREFEARWDECAADCNPGHRRPYRHGRGDYCPLAGMRRNREMVQAYKLAGGSLVLAFPAANARSSGTKNCAHEAWRIGLDVVPPIPLIVQVPAKRQPATRDGKAT